MEMSMDSLRIRKGTAEIPAVLIDAVSCRGTLVIPRKRLKKHSSILIDYSVECNATPALLDVFFCDAENIRLDEAVLTVDVKTRSEAGLMVYAKGGVSALLGTLQIDAEPLGKNRYMLRIPQSGRMQIWME
jgi:hypothetical protein